MRKFLSLKTPVVMAGLLFVNAVVIEPKGLFSELIRLAMQVSGSVR